MDDYIHEHTACTKACTYCYVIGVQLPLGKHCRICGNNMGVEPIDWNAVRDAMKKGLGPLRHVA
jgi:hypothetical protein